MIKNKAHTIVFFISILLPVFSYGMKLRQLGKATKPIKTLPTTVRPTSTQPKPQPRPIPTQPTGHPKPTGSIGQPTRTTIISRRSEPKFHPTTFEQRRQDEEFEELEKQIELMRANAPYVGPQIIEPLAQEIKRGLDNDIPVEDFANIFKTMATKEIDLKAIFIDPSATDCIGIIKKWENLPSLSKEIIIISYGDGSYMFFTTTDGKPDPAIVHNLSFYSKYTNPTIESLYSKIPNAESTSDYDGALLLAKRLDNQANKFFKSNLDHYKQIIELAKSLNVPEEKIAKAQNIVDLIESGEKFSAEDIEKSHDSFLETEKHLQKKQSDLAEKAAEEKKIEEEKIERENIIKEKEQKVAEEIVEQERISAEEKEKKELAEQAKKEEAAKLAERTAKEIEELNKKSLPEAVEDAEEYRKNELLEKEEAEKANARLEAERKAQLKAEKEKEEQEIIAEATKLIKAEKQPASEGTAVTQPVVLTPIEPSETIPAESLDLQPSEIVLKHQLITTGKQPAPEGKAVTHPALLTPIEPSEIIPAESLDLQSSDILPKRQLITAGKQPAPEGNAVTQPVVLTPIEPSEITPAESLNLQSSEIVIPEKEEEKEEQEEKKEKKIETQEKEEKTEGDGEGDLKKEEEKEQKKEEVITPILPTVTAVPRFQPTQLTELAPEQKLVGTEKQSAPEGTPLAESFVPITTSWLPTETPPQYPMPTETPEYHSAPITMAPQPELQPWPIPQFLVQPQQASFQPQEPWGQQQPWPLTPGPRELPQIATPSFAPLSPILPPSPRLRRTGQRTSKASADRSEDKPEGRPRDLQPAPQPQLLAAPQQYQRGTTNPTFPGSYAQTSAPTTSYSQQPYNSRTPSTSSYSQNTASISYAPTSGGFVTDQAQQPTEENSPPITKRVTDFFSKIINRVRQPVIVLWERLELVPKWIIDHYRQIWGLKKIEKETIPTPEMEKQTIMPAEEAEISPEPKKETTNPILGAIKDFVSTTISYVKGLFQ